MLIKVLLLLFSKQHKARTIKDIESCAGNPRESYSVKYCPLLPIDLDHVVPDKLHWFLRVMDVLLENVVLQVVQLDVKVNKKQTDPLQGPEVSGEHPGVWCTISDMAKGLWFICTGLDITRRSRNEESYLQTTCLFQRHLAARLQRMHYPTMEGTCTCEKLVLN